MRIVDATRWKTVGGTGDDVRLHQSYDLATGKMDQVQLTTRYQAESLSHFALAEGDLMVTDAGYPVPSSVEVTQQSKSFLLQRTTASHLHIENEQGQTMVLKEQVRGQRADSLKQIKGWDSLAQKWRADPSAPVMLSLTRRTSQEGARSQSCQTEEKARAQVQPGVGLVGQLGLVSDHNGRSHVERARSGLFVSCSLAD